ncbi:MAG: class I SAM-dependent methyltransferase [Alphaproteobacteria bacterium]
MMDTSSEERGATAWAAWDARWRTAEGRARWLEPEPEARALAAELRARGGRSVLDLGCGVGRHAVYVAGEGFAVSAMDAASSGLDYARDWASREGVTLDLSFGQMTALPYEDASFDAVIAWNVIYYGEPPVIEAALSEIRRVLRPRGLYLGTFLSKRHARYGQGREIARDTFVIDGVEERDHPHHYCDARGVVDFMVGFELWSLVDRCHEGPDTYHWHLLAERLPG